MGTEDLCMKKIVLVLTISLVAFLAIKMGRTNPVAQKTVQIGSQSLSIEVVSTPAEITKGLGERDALGSDGMLFVMPSREIPSFWMMGMRFDLDFIWIDGDKVIDITENVSAEPGANPNQLKTYSPKSPVTHVLEMNAGEVQKRGIKIGDTVRFSY